MTLERTEKPIRVGARVRRWDGVLGTVGMNTQGKSAYEAGEHFVIEWDDGEAAFSGTLAEFEHEGIQRTGRVAAWAR